jgi:hypothetical protein
MKYLEVILDSKRFYRSYVNRSLSYDSHGQWQLYLILNEFSSVSVNLPLNIHKTVVRSIITYAEYATVYGAKTHFSKVLVLHNKVIKILREQSVTAQKSVSVSYQDYYTLRSQPSDNLQIAN